MSSSNRVVAVAGSDGRVNRTWILFGTELKSQAVNWTTKYILAKQGDWSPEDAEPLGLVRGGWPCNDDTRPFAVCAQYMAPYADNAYYWQNTCGLTESSDVIIADHSGIEPWPYDVTDCGSGYVSTCCTEAWEDPGTAACSIAVDCDVTTGDPPVLNDVYYLPSWWADWGCALDNGTHLLSDVIVNILPGNTPQSSLNLCSELGYSMGGMENGDECYCGTAPLEPWSPADGLDTCVTRCPGNYLYTCGGPSLMQVFEYLV
ncbi:hypothetical protein NM688_g919 [Phlebia brevispora]|uniref:Uncharacterized protein n=1 Tax=Phlebia brevispora TaxID=194682 RepID=A0ACC1TCU8_9APHY|nr:hypothetical protein NM688_g919 [Phlebia brevispora]